jgi:hypothetical protein
VGATNGVARSPSIICRRFERIKRIPQQQHPETPVDLQPVVLWSEAEFLTNFVSTRPIIIC